MSKSKARWLVLGIIVTLLLSACSSTITPEQDIVELEVPVIESESVPAVQEESTNASQSSETAVAVAPTDSPEPTAVPSPEPPPTPSETLESSAELIVDDPTSEVDVVIMTDDDRSDRLKNVTFDWNTNWERHTVDYSEILSGGPPRDGIPSIDDPKFVTPEEAAEWLVENEPVISLEINGDARAYPLQVLTWHEIANDVVGDIPVVVTFCPLCNSALVFDRRANGEILEFGVSGLLRNSDLIMYDRTTETLWQQFTGDAIIGDMVGRRLKFHPSSIVSFADFRTAFPDGSVLSRDTGYDRFYGSNPYVGYDTIGQNPFLFLGPTDGRLPAMERVVTVPLADADVAYPLSILSEVGVINDNQAGQDLVVFHTSGTSSALGTRIIAQGEDVGATGVFDPNLNGQLLTFQKDGSEIVDDETGTIWNVLGQATTGPLSGQQLTPIVHADHFWFSWAAFKPLTIIYQP